MADKVFGQKNVFDNVNIVRIRECETVKRIESDKGSVTADNNCGKHGEKSQDLSKRRKRGADVEIADICLLSEEKSLTKLRPRKSVPSFRKVELSDGDFERIVGKRVKVYWSGSRRWFAGCIKSFDNDKKVHRILYDDGEREDLDLKRERFELEIMSSEGFSICPTPASSNGKKVTSEGGEVCEDMKITVSPNLNDVVPLKRYVRMNAKTPSKAVRCDLDEGSVTKEKENNMDSSVEVEVRPANSKHQVTSDDANFVTYRDDIDNVNKVLVASGVPYRNEDSSDEGKMTEKKANDMDTCVEVDVHPEKSKHRVTSDDGNFVTHRNDVDIVNRGVDASGVPYGKEKSSDVEGIDDDCQERGDLASVQAEEENLLKPPKKRKRGATGEIAKELLLSSKESSCNFKLRPQNFLPSFQKVELNEKDFERIVGKKVKVYWPTSRRWFVGCIKSFDNEKKLHRILYDGGEKEDVDLPGELFELEVTSNEALNICSKSGPNREKVETSSAAVEVGEERNRNAHLNKKQATKAVENQLHDGRFYNKTEDMGRDTGLSVQPENNEDLVRSSENTYWFVYDEAFKELKRNGSPGEENAMVENAKKAAEKGSFQPLKGSDTEDETENMVSDEEVDIQSRNISENTYWYMYVAQV